MGTGLPVVSGRKPCSWEAFWVTRVVIDEEGVRTGVRQLQSLGQASW